MRYILWASILWLAMLSSVRSVWADEAQQVKMLKYIFAQPTDRWQQLLAENKSLLDPEFFERIEQRIHWDKAQCQVEDGIRFAMIGDIALKVVGQGPRFVAMLEGPQAVMVRRAAPAVTSFPVRSAESRQAIRNARAAVAQGKSEMAERLYRDALVDHPKSPTGWLELARFHETHGKFELALQEYRQVTRLWPRQERTWLLRGKAVEASFDRAPGWEAVDEARLCYGKAGRLGESTQSSLNRLNSKARAFARQIIDLDAPGAWELKTGQFHTYEVGETFATHPLEAGDPISGGSRIAESGEWYPLVSLPGEALEDYLARSYRSSEDGDCSLIEPEYFVSGGLWRGQVVWLRSEFGDTRLCREGKVIGVLNSPLARWPLGTPFACFRDRQSGAEIQLFRSPMCEIGLEVTQGKVRAIYLMEPGRLRVNLQRLPRYRLVR